MKTLAIVTARNEALHIGRCLRNLIEEGLDVVLIDHDSVDDTRSIATAFLGRGLLRIETLPWKGYFSLTEQLHAKQAIIEWATHPWVAHFDADEWPRAATPFRTLGEGIAEADRLGYNSINFHEFVFLPRPGQDFCSPNYARRMTSYYFFEPSYPRLNRIWKRDTGLSNADTGGHQLTGGERRLFPHDFHLRHYIVLNEEQAFRKYLGRTFSREDLGRGWHHNRLSITPEALRRYFRGETGRAGQLRQLGDATDNDFDTSNPQTKHFWEWDE